MSPTTVERGRTESPGDAAGAVQALGAAGPYKPGGSCCGSASRPLAAGEHSSIRQVPATAACLETWRALVAVTQA